MLAPFRIVISAAAVCAFTCGSSTTLGQAFWQQPWQVNECSGLGTKRYASQLMNIPAGQDWQTFCEHMPADINGQHFNRPTRCINNAGMWGEFDVREPACQPFWGPFTPGNCISGSRVFSARLWNITGDWMTACLATPATVHGHSFTHPLLQCVDRREMGMWGEVRIADGACTEVNVRGTVTYQDGPSMHRPFSFGTVEVWACGTRVGPSCTWGKVASVLTDHVGRFSAVLVPPRDPADKYVARVVAENDAAYVYAQDTLNRFYADLGNEQTATALSRTLVFDRHFGGSGYDLFVSRHLNAAQKLLTARRFVERFRDASETDTLGKVGVAPAVGGWGAENSGMIHLHPNDLENEPTLLHEYGHFVQESIGLYLIDPRLNHDPCNVSDPNYAWFEGFPEFLQKAVRLMNSADVRVPVLPVHLGSSPSCALTSRPEATESVVTDALFLLLNDGAGTCTGFTAPLCRRNLWNTRAALIMGIFDKEFDQSAPGAKNLLRFRDIWVARGASGPYINSVFAEFGL